MHLQRKIYSITGTHAQKQLQPQSKKLNTYNYK